MTPANELRELAKSDEILVAPGVFDGLTANIVEHLGFNVLYQGGYATGASTSHTEPIISLTEMSDRSREIVENTSLPLIVDGDAGFGNAPHTYRAVNAYAKAGIAGMHIEDQVYPKRLHYHAGRNHITTIDEMEHKIETALQSREDHNEDIVIIARSDAGRGHRRDELNETVEDAVKRVNHYLDVGAEIGMVFPQSREELQYAADNIDGPFLFTMVEGREPSPTVDKMNEMGVDIAIYALSATINVAKSVHEMYHTLSEEGHTDFDPKEYTKFQGYVEERIDLPKYYDIEEKEGKK